MAERTRRDLHLSAAEVAIERERCRRSCQYFVFESGLVTKDEHDLANPVKGMYDEGYLRVMVDVLCVSGRVMEAGQARYARGAGLSEEFLSVLAASGIVCVEKSRQMLVTWIVCAYLLWRAKYYPHQLLLVQSKREDDAANLVFNKEAFFARISFLESHLPKHLRTLVFPRNATYGHLYFPNGSHIWGIPEGGDIIRSNTPSVVFSDESAFQAEFDKSYTAALPAIKGGGQYIAVSSAEPGSFATLVEAS